MRRTANGFVNVDPDDRNNVVAGHGVRDRWRMLTALREGLHEIPLGSPNYERRRDDVLAWVALELFYVLKREARMSWGRGMAGDAYFPRGTPKYGGKRRGRWAGDRDNLLLNRIDADFVDPRFRAANLAHELDQFRRRLYRSIVARGMYVEQSWLVLHILESVHRTAGESVSPDDVESWRDTLRRGRRLHVRALQAPFTTRSLPDTLAYYGVADRAKGDERGYWIRFVQVESLDRRWRARGTIELQYLEWMKGKYEFAT